MLFLPPERSAGRGAAFVAFFAEAEGFAHLHVHVVPRSDDLPREHLGPGVFQYLQQPPERWVSPTTMDEIADRLRPLLAEAVQDN